MVHEWAGKLVVGFLKRLAAVADGDRWPPAGVLSDQWSSPAAQANGF